MNYNKPQHEDLRGDERARAEYHLSASSRKVFLAGELWIHGLEENPSSSKIAFNLLELDAAHDGSGTDFEMSLTLPSQLR